MTTDTPMLLWDDTPRTRATDPVTSHIAADISGKKLRPAKLAVLYVFSLHRPMLGSELNDVYALATNREMVPMLALDSPRRRAFEMERDGYLVVSSVRRAEGNNTFERELALTDKGRAALKSGGF
jgi:hypothetical protein